MGNRGRPGIDQDSLFSVLEHADEHGQVPSASGSTGASSSRPAQQPKSKPNTAKHQTAKQAQGTGRPAGAAAQTSRAEDFYRAFEHVFEDPSTGVKETVLRFHKTKIVRIRPNGDFMLTSGGWHTATTVAALNDALQALGMKLTYEPPVSAGRWIVTDDEGKQYQFKDNMVIKATKAEHGQRGAKLLRVYNGGAQVPRYARKPAAAGAAGQQAPPGQAAARPAPAPQQQQPRQQPAAVTHAGPKAAGAEQLEQIMAAFAEVRMDEEEDVDENQICVVCLENPREEVLVPCGHWVMCSECCTEIKNTTNECPMCRQEILESAAVDFTHE